MMRPQDVLVSSEHDWIISETASPDEKMRQLERVVVLTLSQHCDLHPEALDFYGLKQQMDHRGIQLPEFDAFWATFEKCKYSTDLPDEATVDFLNKQWSKVVGTLPQKTSEK
jgi:hypothetical protein